jgi:hypothetical protein
MEVRTSAVEVPVVAVEVRASVVKKTASVLKTARLGGRPSENSVIVVYIVLFEFFPGMLPLYLVSLSCFFEFSDSLGGGGVSRRIANQALAWGENNLPGSSAGRIPFP